MKLRGALVASAALGLLCAAPAMADSHGDGDGDDGSIACAGINSCSGKGDCAAADGSHDCGGQNSCKGKGWIYTDSEEDCIEAGGEIIGD